MRKPIIGRRTLLVLGGIGSLIAFVLANGPSVVRDWSEFLKPKPEATVVSGPLQPRRLVSGAEAFAAPTTAQPSAAPPEPPRDTAAATPSPEVMKLSLKVSMSVVGEGIDQRVACAAAVTDVVAAVNRRCERVSLQNNGRRFSVADEDDPLQCTGCAYVGDRWRCAARLSSDCKIYE